MSKVPSTCVDMFSAQTLSNPYPVYQELRKKGAVIWLEKHGVHGFVRYDEVRYALENPDIFSSAQGVTLNDWINDVQVGSLLASDSPEHEFLRNIIERPLRPAQLRALNERIEAEAQIIVDRLVAQGTFDAVTELGQHLPLTVVSELVGLPSEGQNKMIEWATAAFDSCGPDSERIAPALKTAHEMIAFTRGVDTRSTLQPGGWGAQLFEAADRGEISVEQANILLQDYVAPSLDTTIMATASAIWLFAQHPEQWDLLRSNPRLMPNAINEIIRMEPPFSGFTRIVTRDTVVDGVLLKAGSRVFLYYASANRDERKWIDPERFDITRNVVDHLGFGFGIHRCLGANLARLEISALLRALLPKVSVFEIGDRKRVINSIISGWSSLQVSVQ